MHVCVFRVIPKNVVILNTLIGHGNFLGGVCFSPFTVSVSCAPVV